MVLVSVLLLGRFHRRWSAATFSSFFSIFAKREITETGREHRGASERARERRVAAGGPQLQRLTRITKAPKSNGFKRLMANRESGIKPGRKLDLLTTRPAHALSPLSLHLSVSLHLCDFLSRDRRKLIYGVSSPNPPRLGDRRKLGQVMNEPEKRTEVCCV